MREALPNERTSAMFPRKTLLVFAASAVASLGAVACGDDNESPSTTTSATTGAPGASVEFLAPKKGTTTGPTVTTKVRLSNFKLAPNDVGKAPVEGEGHLHFSMDDGKFDYPKYSGANGKLAKQLHVEGKYSPALKPTITYSNLPTGQHNLEVYLANNNHTNTGVEAKTTFIVKQVP